MLLAADASVLVAELIRKRGRRFFVEAELQTVVSMEQSSEMQHELQRRLRHIVEQGRLDASQAAVIQQEVQELFDTNTIELAPAHSYHHFEPIARRRIPRDPNDWPTVALALALGAAILTEDHDFLGCGIATWTFQTLRDALAHGDVPL